MMDEDRLTQAYISFTECCEQKKNMVCIIYSLVPYVNSTMNNDTNCTACVNYTPSILGELVLRMTAKW